MRRCAPRTDAAARSSSSRPTPTSNEDGLAIPPSSPKATAAATTIGNGTSRTKIATNDATRDTDHQTVRERGAGEPDRRLRDDGDHGRRQSREGSRHPPELAVGDEDPGERHQQEEARQHEGDARDEPAPDPVEEPPDVRGELHRLGSRQQHAVAQRVQEPTLVDPAAAFDQLLMHQRDLAGRTPEVHEAEPDPEPGRLAEARWPRRVVPSRLVPSWFVWPCVVRRAGHRARGYARRVQLTPTEEERLRVFTAAQLARATLAKGLRLNAPEAVALVCDEMHAAGRGGASFDEVAAAGRAAVRPDQVIDGVAGIVPEIRVEVLLEEGTRLLVLREPFGSAGTTIPARSASARATSSSRPGATGSISE